MANVYTWKLALFAAMGAVQVGYFFGSLNGLLEMQGFQETFPELFDCNGSLQYSVNDSSSGSGHSLSDMGCDEDECNNPRAATILGLMISVGNLGSVFGTLIAGWLSDQFGRRVCQMIGGAVMSLGVIIMGCTLKSMAWLFITGRAVAGIGIGIIYMVMPVYISELSHKRSRGVLSSTIGPGFTIALLLANILNIGWARFLLGWRVSFGVQLLLGIIYVLGLLLVMPETPRWLSIKNRDKEALLILSKINGHKKEEMCFETLMDFEELKHCAVDYRASYCSVKDFKVVFKKNNLSRVIYSLLLFCLASPSGNYLSYYSTTLFMRLGLNGFTTNLSVGSVTVLGSLLGLLVIDCIGRKALLLIGSSFQMLLLCTAATLIAKFDLENCGNILLEYVVVTLVCICVFTYALSWGVIPWIVGSEIFPLQSRGLSVALTSATFWFMAFLTTQFVPIALETINTYGLFYITTGVNAFSFLFVLFFGTETKEVSLEAMDEHFSRSWLKRVDLFWYLSCGVQSLFKICYGVRRQTLEVMTGAQVQLELNGDISKGGKAEFSDNKEL